MANVFEDFWGAIRKYIIPDSLGGGHTDAEKEKIKEDWGKAQDEVEKNKDRNDGNYDPTEPLIETITGIPSALQSFNWLIGGFVVIIFILLTKD